MVIHVHQGKASRDREVPLTPKLLEALREYWRCCKVKPRVYLFPTRVQAIAEERPVSDKAIWNACRDTALRAGLTKRIGPHTLRHSFATHLLEAGIGAFLSHRAGGSQRTVFSSIGFPILPYLAFFLVGFPVALILDDHVAHNIMF